MASREMRRERPGHTLQPTALVNEAYLRLLGGAGGAPAWNDRTHFLSAAARAMRNVLVDHARARNAQKRGSGLRVTLDDELRGAGDPGLDFLELNDALERLAAEEPRWARVVELRYFGGLELAEIAQALDVSTITVSRDWRFAKAWLAQRLSGHAE
jgi:RNA polymerase sigma factor (TIGR02999 family)